MCVMCVCVRASVKPRLVSRALLHLVDDGKQRVQREKVRGEEVARGRQRVL